MLMAYWHQWQLLLSLINSFNKTEAAVFTCRLCFTGAFPFISLIIPYTSLSFKIQFIVVNTFLKPECYVSTATLRIFQNPETTPKSMAFAITVMRFACFEKCDLVKGWPTDRIQFIPKQWMCKSCISVSTYTDIYLHLLTNDA